MEKKSSQNLVELDQLDQLDEMQIDDILQVLGNWEFLPDQPALVEEKMTHVRISEDEMEAWLYLTPPEEKQNYSKEMLLELLNENGVKVGLISSNLSAMVKKEVYEREILVAKGALPEEGIPGYYEFFFKTDSVIEPRFRLDGSVDYSSFQVLKNVSKEDILAIYHPVVKGKAGYTVKGKFIPQKMIAELPALKGRGFYRKPEEPETYRAMMSGKIDYKNGVIQIESTHVIEGDVTSVNGRIEFFGDILIKGNVEAGVVIRTAKSLTINGNVEAEKSVILTGKKGLLIGGYTHATESFESTTVGNEVEVKTVIHVGSKPELLEKKKSLQQSEQYLKEELANLVRELYQIKKLMRENPDVSVLSEELKKVNAKRNDLLRKIEGLNEEYAKVEEMIERGRKAYIKINGSVYRGTTVCIGNNQHTLSNGTCYMKYTNQDGRLIGTVTVRN